MKLRSLLHAVWHALGVILFPGVCPFCGEVSKTRFLSPDGICRTCRVNIPVIGDPYCLKCGKPLKDAAAEYCSDCAGGTHYFEQGRALYVHEGPVKEAVYRLKYGGRKCDGEVFGREMARAFEQWIRDRRIAVIIPIPLHKRRYRERGYNQASVIAHALAGRLHIKCCDDVLIRPHATKRLKTLGRSGRKEMLQGVFEARPERAGNEFSRSILLVDDIYTTGSTLDEAARTLKAAGAGKVYFLTFTIGKGR